ncbi:MAG TPA: hypothetical protein VGM86_29090, partial [Thermoanaerobaculia bacterium]
LHAWLAGILPHPKIERDLINLVPFFVEREGASNVVDVIAPLARLLSDEARRELDEDAREGGFRIPWQEHSLNARLISQLAGLLERAIVTEREVAWQQEERELFHGILDGLGLYLEYSDEPNIEKGYYLPVAESYTKLLAYGLKTPDLANETYQEVVQYAPFPELYEITEFALSSGGLSAERALSVLRISYSEERADEVIKEAMQAVGIGGKVRKNLSKPTGERLRLYRSLDKGQRELADYLVTQDHLLPPASVWIQGLTGGAE